TVVSGAPYLHDGLAVRIRRVPPWLAAGPPAGRIAAGQSLDVDIHFDATGLAGGDYAAALPIRSNDPVQDSIAVPVALHVTAAPDLAITPTAVDFDTVFAGYRQSFPVTLTNQGFTNLEVTSI